MVGCIWFDEWRDVYLNDIMYHVKVVVHNSFCKDSLLILLNNARSPFYDTAIVLVIVGIYLLERSVLNANFKNCNVSIFEPNPVYLKNLAWYFTRYTQSLSDYWMLYYLLIFFLFVTTKKGKLLTSWMISYLCIRINSL